MSAAEQLAPAGLLWTPASMGHAACAEGCPEPEPRPYARKKLPSVTTILSQIAKPALEWGASKEAALFAVHHQADWRGLDPDDAVDRIRRHFRGVWDKSADVGTAVHSVNEAWCEGQQWDDETHFPNRIKEEHRAEVLRRMPGYVEGLAAFWADCKPATVAMEVPVRKVDRWIGTADWIADLLTPQGVVERYLLDIKTTSELDPDKGMYLDSWRPQLAAYFHADEAVHYHGKEEVASWPIEDCFARPTKAAILHLRGDGGYQLIEVDVHAPLIEAVLTSCAVLHQWSLVGGHRTPAPIIVSERRREPIAPRPSAPVNVEAMLG